ISLKYQAEYFECGYQDYWRAQHHRSVKLDKKQIMVKDTVKNFKEQAVLRWRLTPDNWQLNGHILSNGKIQLEINSSSEVIITLTQGEESRYYYQKTFLPVLEVLTMQPTTIFTLIKDIT
ncbi:MAG: weeF, partial [Pseudomonadales bacterium]|nr:weeF [Pseudomonadales bacterium]